MRTLISLSIVLICTISNGQTFILDGPDAPDANVSTNGQNFIFDLYNTPSSNNYMEGYVEYNPNIPGSMADSAFRFQGYLIYQINENLFDQEYINANYILDAVLTNTNVARLQGQSDLSDTNTNYVNHVFDSVTLQCNSYNIISNSNNTGTTNHYELLTDAFTGNPFSPGNTYCFIALSYAVHHFNYDQGCSPMTKPLFVSKKGVSGAFNKYCLDLATMSISRNEIQSSAVYINQNMVIETSSTTAEFTLFTMDGKVVRRKEINSHYTEIDIQNLSYGIYFYQLKSGLECKTEKIFIPKN